MKSIRTEDTDNYGNVVEMKKRVPFFLWIGITAILLAAAVVVTVAILTKCSDPASYEEKMDLGRKYLLELDYDQAILAFEEAIKINPKKKDAYLELAEVYVETGEPEKAVKILEKAEKKVQDEDDLEEITEKKLKMVDKAEQYLLDLGFHQLRVRIHGSIARIELLPKEFSKFMEEKIREDVYSKLKEIGFTYVTLDVKGYRTGSMNETLTEDEKK